MSIYIFECYRFCDVIKFLQLIESEEAILLQVIHEGEDIVHTYKIWYHHTHELTMLVHT